MKIISQYYVFTPSYFEINLLIINTLSYINIYSNGKDCLITLRKKLNLH